jgi:hypothetical protein
MSDGENQPIGVTPEDIEKMKPSSLTDALKRRIAEMNAGVRAGLNEEGQALHDLFAADAERHEQKMAAGIVDDEDEDDEAWSPERRLHTHAGEMPSDIEQVRDLMTQIKTICDRHIPDADFNTQFSAELRDLRDALGMDDDFG